MHTQIPKKKIYFNFNIVADTTTTVITNVIKIIIVTFCFADAHLSMIFTIQVVILLVSFPVSVRKIQIQIYPISFEPCILYKINYFTYTTHLEKLTTCLDTRGL